MLSSGAFCYSYHIFFSALLLSLLSLSRCYCFSFFFLLLLLFCLLFLLLLLLLCSLISPHLRVSCSTYNSGASRSIRGTLCLTRYAVMLCCGAVCRVSAQALLVYYMRNSINWSQFHSFNIWSFFNTNYRKEKETLILKIKYSKSPIYLN